MQQFKSFSDVPTFTYVCDFYRNQAWERWLKRKNKVKADEKEMILTELKAIGETTTDVTSYQDKLAEFQSSPEYNIKPVKKYLSRWLSCPHRRVKALRSEEFKLGNHHN